MSSLNKTHLIPSFTSSLLHSPPLTPAGSLLIGDTAPQHRREQFPRRRHGRLLAFGCSHHNGVWHSVMITVIRETFRAGMKELAIKPTYTYLGSSPRLRRVWVIDSSAAATHRRDDEALKYFYFYKLTRSHNVNTLTGQTYSPCQRRQLIFHRTFEAMFARPTSFF